jgi:hypothetical protein
MVTVEKLAMQETLYHGLIERLSLFSWKDGKVDREDAVNVDFESGFHRSEAETR